MQIAKLMFVAVTAELVSTMVAPAQAQQDATKRNVLQKTTTPVKPAIMPTGPTAPNRRDHRTTANDRDHRTGDAQGGVTVTGGKKRNTTECVKSVLGGPCIGGKWGKPLVDAVKTVKKGQDYVIPPKDKPAPNRDHRTPRRITGDSGLPR
jgi:hypothetical protein